MNDQDNPQPDNAPPSGGTRPSGPAAVATARPIAPEGPVHVVLQSTHSPWRRLLAGIGWAGFILCAILLMNQWSARSDYMNASRGIRERLHSGEEYGPDKVAVIAVRGVILEGDGFVKRQIDRVRQDEDVKAVVLRVDSPGGTVTGSDYIYHHLNRLRQERNLPLVVSMGSMAASGGYYVSMAVGEQEQSIFAEPTTTTGSIGVIVPHYDISGLLAKYDVIDDSVASHSRKQLLSMTRSMSTEDRQIIQQYVDDSFGRFKTIVKSGRPKLRQASPDDALVDPATQQDLATGEIFPAQRALEHGLVDQIGFIEDAIDRAIELAGLDAKRVRVIEYQRPASLLNLMGTAQAAQQRSEFSNLLEMSAPRAYFLATSLPLLLSSRREEDRWGP